MGDVLFKIEPQILTAKPDITFIKLDQTKDTIIVMATDGLWDHLNTTKAPEQITSILNYITSQLTNASEDESLKSLEDCSSSESNNYFGLIGKIAEELTMREDNDEMFVGGLARYDDISVSITYMPANEY
jgi:serine/threonine protein phosphatase PrpC